MKIVFFDGECTLCNFFVDFLIRRDSNRQLKFASLQGETAQKLIPQLAKPPYASIVFIRDGNPQIESDAALAAIAELGSLWTAVYVFKVVPKAVRDVIYRFVATNRYKWFGKKDQCRLPTPEERSYFLP